MLGLTKGHIVRLLERLGCDVYDGVVPEAGMRMRAWQSCDESVQGSREHGGVTDNARKLVRMRVQSSQSSRVVGEERGRDIKEG
jgi:hypothetical protein